MKKFALPLAAAALLTVPVVAEAFSTARGVRVNPVTSTIFEVIPRSSGSVDDFWCGAAEYARRSLGAGWRDPIYVVRGRGVSETTGRRSSVQFSVSATDVPGGLKDQHWLRVGIQPGDSMSVQQANTYCSQRPARP